ncbi:MAG: DUF2971 domain-containing protein, partial [Flavobacteriaceae bacterium]|nr:DUF2971 domain-containing protein [Flavobacteriaceae bacterium]
MNLYRFQPINDESKECLINKENWVSDPTDFNDPFEFSFRMENLNKQKTEEEEEEEEKSKYDAITEGVKEIGVVCYSSKGSEFGENIEVYENKLQWSHYADKHKGMCLVFDFPDDSRDLHKIDYEVLPPIINLNLNQWCFESVFT